MGLTYRYRKKGIYRIYVRRSLPPLTLFKTLVHELFHAIELDYKLDIPHELIDALENPIVSLLLKNYGVTPWKALSPKTRTRAISGHVRS